MLIALVNLLVVLEGFSSCAYWDRTNYRNGYGTTALAANECISEPEARVRLAKRAEIALNAVKKHTHLTKNQIVALSSFRYNIGPNAFDSSTINTLLVHKHTNKITAELSKWVYSSGKVLDGLKKRRSLEMRVFNGENI